MNPRARSSVGTWDLLDQSSYASTTSWLHRGSCSDQDFSVLPCEYGSAGMALRRPVRRFSSHRLHWMPYPTKAEVSKDSPDGVYTVYQAHNHK